MKRLLLLVLLWLSLPMMAEAAVPVELPSGQDPQDWAEAARFAGASLGPAGSGPGVRIEVEGSRWRVQVRGRDGGLRELLVAPPRTAAEREDLLVTALSLVEPAEARLPGLALPPPPPARKPAPKKPPVEPVEPVEPDPPPVVVEVVPAPPPAEEPLPPPPVQPPPDPDLADENPNRPLEEPPEAGPGPILRLGLGPQLRRATEPTWEGLVGIGLERDRWRLVLGLERSGATGLALGDEHDLRSTRASARFELGGPAGPSPGIAMGFSRREWIEAGERVGTTWTPQLSLAAGWGIAGPGPLRLRPLLGGSLDLGRTDIHEEGVLIGTLPRFSTSLLLLVEVGPEIE